MDRETLYCLSHMQGTNTLIKAKNIKVYIENEQPYIHFIGTFNDRDTEYEIDIPKMDVNITAIIKEVDTCYAERLDGLKLMPITLRRDIFVSQDCVEFSIRCIKKKMTKEQIEKELGYKIDIEGEDDD